MGKITWQEVVAQRAAKDDWYRSSVQTILRLEPDCITILNALPESHRQTLEDYLFAVERRERTQLHIAYNLGKEQGKKMAAGIPDDLEFPWGQ